jgi:hypothetical protein
METPLLETVIVEWAVTPDGRPVINVHGVNLQAPPEALWERIILLLQLGLRAAIVHTVTPQAAAPRIVPRTGFVLPPPPDRH